MRVTMSRVELGQACPECNLANIAVFYVNVDFAGDLWPLTCCAACLSALGANLQHQARITNKATA